MAASDCKLENELESETILRTHHRQGCLGLKSTRQGGQPGLQSRFQDSQGHNPDTKNKIKAKRIKRIISSIYC